MKAKTKASLIMSGLFAAGLAVGSIASLALTQRHYAKLVGEPRHEVMRERRLAGLTRKLDLNEQQQGQVRAIMDRHGDAYQAAMRDMFARCGEKLRAERSKIDGEIKVVLDPQQQKKFDELSQRHRRRFMGAPRR